MKIFRHIAALLLLVIVTASSSLAADFDVYELDGLDMTISFPAGTYAFTRDIASNDARLQEKYFPGDAELDYFYENDIHCYVMCADPLSDIIVSMYEHDDITDVFSLNLCTDSQLKNISNDLAEELYYYYDTDILQQYVYSSSQADYIVLEYRIYDGEYDAASYQFFTRYNGRSYYIWMHSYDYNMPTGAQFYIERLIDNISFTKTIELPASILALTGTTSFNGFTFETIDYIFSSFGYFIIIFLIVFGVLRRSARAKRSAAQSARTNADISPPPLYSSGSCRFCGSHSVAGSRYCGKCGAAIETGAE